ncbi:MAG: ATP-binding protein, partial [Geobacteraceae bacterium]|nr:ATP-binding protein [Geobacteraceae bacterium]
MKLHDLKIGTQMRLAHGAILALVVCLGILAWYQTDQLWRQTKNLYDHPLTVRRAIGKMEVDIERMSRHVRALFLARNNQETSTALQGIELEKGNAEKQLDILFNRYLGPHEDLTALRQDFVKWNTLRDETIRLYRSGKTAEAEARLRTKGIQNAQGVVLRSHVRTIDDFARSKADEFYHNATELNHSLNVQFVVVITIIFLLSLGLSYLLLKGIRDPLRELTALTEHFRLGKFDARSKYVSVNELGTLSAAFNTLGETIEGNLTFKEHAVQLNDAMLQELKDREFRSRVLEQLIRLTNSQAGAIYLLNEQKTDYEHLESIGLGSAGRASFSATEREGEFGPALVTQQIQRITNIPTDTRFTFTAVSGEFTPREIITIPLISGNNTPAMISLASIHNYESAAVRLITDIQGALASWINSMLDNQRIKALTNNLELQNSQLQSQQEELRVTNEELEEQTQQLQSSEEELKIQQEELQVTNEELEEKNDLLERQTKEVERARKEIEEKAEALALASKYKSEFLANMSHELRTPLNSLLLLAQGLARNKNGNLTEEQVESARIIHSSGSDLLSLINEILDLSKIEAGRIELQFGTVTVADLTEGVRDSFQHVADERGIGLEIVVNDDAPGKISSDLKRVEQIIRNLVSNAIKFTEKGGVTVTFGRPASNSGLSWSGIPPGDCLAIAVRDTGIGITPEQHKVIFEAFQQADGGTSRKYGGTGLGLSISRELATLLGGEIHLASEPGKGSTFTLYLPPEIDMQAPRLHAAITPPKKKVPVENGQPEIPDDRNSIEPSDRVMLVIEDDPNFIRLLQEKCHEKGFKCLAASTGEDGLELASRHLPRAVILDLQLPGIDGWEVLRSLK